MFREEINEILLAPKVLIESLKKSEALSIGILLNLDKDNLFDKIIKCSELVNQEFNEGGIFNISKEELKRPNLNILFKNQGIYNGLLGVALLYGTFFSPNKEVMQAIPLMMIALYILLSKKIVVNRFEKIILSVFSVIEYIVVALCNSRGALYSIIVVFLAPIARAASITPLSTSRNPISTKRA